MKSELQKEGATHEVEFVWLWLAGEAEEKSRVTRAVELGEEADTMIEAIFPPVIAYYFGALPHFKIALGARQKFVESLQREFGSSAKLYHGRALARSENIGSDFRFAFAIMMSGRTKLLADLCALQFGEYRLYEKRG